MASVCIIIHAAAMRQIVCLAAPMYTVPMVLCMCIYTVKRLYKRVVQLPPRKIPAINWVGSAQYARRVKSRSARRACVRVEQAPRAPAAFKSGNLSPREEGVIRLFDGRAHCNKSSSALAWFTAAPKGLLLHLCSAYYHQPFATNTLMGIFHMHSNTVPFLVIQLRRVVDS